MQAFSAPIIKYILALNTLDNENGIRCVDIAENLDLSKPTVHIMMQTHSSRGYVLKARYGMVFLTEEGRKLSARYADYYAKVCLFLTQKLTLSEEESKKAALALLAGISDISLEHMCNTLQDLT